MAEHVVQFAPTVFGADSEALARLDAAVAARLGNGGLVRSTDRREGDAMVDWLVAAKGRFPILKVTSHVCLHDEGSGGCAGLVIEG